MNEKINLKIEDLTISGQGVAKYKGITVFVDKAIPGDEIIAEIREEKANYLKAVMINIKKPSENRVKAKCKHFSTCGSCQLQNIDYSGELAFKQNLVKQTIQRIGGFNDLHINPIIGSENLFYYRNKIQLPIGAIGKDIIMGYYKTNSHTIVNLEECYLQSEDLTFVSIELKKWLIANNITAYNETKNTGQIRHLVIRKADYTKEIQVCFVVNSKEFPYTETLTKIIKKINSTLSEYQISSVTYNINQDKGNKIFGSKNVLLLGSEFISEKIVDNFFRISPNTFLQINKTQAEKVYQHLFERLPKKSTLILDLYCGIGTITLNLSNYATEVIGIEENKQAVKDAKRNSYNNNVKNCSFVASKAEELDLKEYGNADIIIVDPPRKGLGNKIITAIKNLNPKKLFYISCNPASLARDLKELTQDNKFIIKEVTPFDFFPQTTHVEVFCELELNL